MRLIVFSDSHGNTTALESIYAKHPNADRYLHLGDGMYDVKSLRERYPDINLLAVKGNTDFTSGDPESAVLEAEGKKIFYTHGHVFGVKQGLELLKEHSKKSGADVVLFGHTHVPFYNFIDGVHYLNPGKAEIQSRCCFGIVDITENGIACTNASIERVKLR